MKQMHKINKNIIETEIGEDLIILELESGNYLKLNETALRIWKYLKQKKSVDEIKKIFSGEYPSSTEIEKDIDDFFNTAKNAKILT